MKLRIRGNSVRLRLLRTEVSELEQKGTVKETCIFGPDNSLTFSVSVTESDQFSASLVDNEISIGIPKGHADEWFRTELVGFEQDISNGDNSLTVLIEKDFVCLTRTDDPDNQNAYPNPDEESC